LDLLQPVIIDEGQKRRALGQHRLDRLIEVVAEGEGFGVPDDAIAAEYAQQPVAETPGNVEALFVAVVDEDQRRLKFGGPLGFAALGRFPALVFDRWGYGA